MKIEAYDADQFDKETVELSKANYIGEVMFLMHDLVARRDNSTELQLKEKE